MPFNFASGFLTGIATVLVGPEKRTFEIPVAHLTTIDFFARAFGGRFKESASKTIELPDEDDQAFELFLQWLYLGLPDSVFQVQIGNFAALVRLLLMADKWCLTQLTVNLAKAVSNYVHDIMRPTKSGRCWDAVYDGYAITSGSQYRFIFVHAALIESWASSVEYLADDMAEWPAFFSDYFKWSNIVTHAWEHEDVDAEIDHVQDCESFLMPLIFETERFPDVFQSLRELCPEADQRRAYLRNFLGM